MVMRRAGRAPPLRLRGRRAPFGAPSLWGRCPPSPQKKATTQLGSGLCVSVAGPYHWRLGRLYSGLCWVEFPAIPCFNAMSLSLLP